jgi:hypothetical protein
MLKKVIIVFLLIILIIFCILLSKTYEGFNNKYPQKKYKPSTNTPIPTALDGTSYMSPDANGDCPSGFERDITDEKSLCNGGCKQGKFYSVEDTVYGCVLLNTKYSQSEYSGSNYPFANDKKTMIISPTSEAKCPNNFKLDIKSGLCHTECEENNLFYGEMGCALLNTKYSQTQYDGSDNPYLIAEDTKTQFVSPTSLGKCPKNFVFDYPSGLCYTACKSGRKFNGNKSGSGNSVLGCN